MSSSPKPVPNASRDRATLEAGERSCPVFELYRQIVPQSRFTMDQFIRLTIALTEGGYLEIGHCTSCHGALLGEHLVPGRRICLFCQQDALIVSRESPVETRAEAEEKRARSGAADTPEAYQQPSFDRVPQLLGASASDLEGFLQSR